jgi:hypothetical protein
MKCPHCKAIYPDTDSHCPVCREPSPLWEARHKEQSLVGYESARPFERTEWTGVPQA